MKRSNDVILALTGGMALLCSVGVIAADTKDKGINRDPDTKPPITAAGAAVEARALAGQLVAYGDQAKDPLALIVAAKILKSSDPQPTDLKKDGDAVPKDAKKEGDNKHEAGAILARAKALAAGRQDLLALATDVEAMTAKGATQGAGRIHWDRVAARRTDMYDITFRGGESAIVYIEGDGDTDLDLYVYDENGNLICDDTDYTDRLLCSWNPRWTGPFRIKVENHGNIWNEYGLVTN